MSLHEELVNESIAQCRICSWLQLQPQADQEEWRAELAQPVSVISHASVQRALKKRGVNLSNSAVHRHRANHT